MLLTEFSLDALSQSSLSTSAGQTTCPGLVNAGGVLDGRVYPESFQAAFELVLAANENLPEHPRRSRCAWEQWSLLSQPGGALQCARQPPAGAQRQRRLSETAGSLAAGGASAPPAPLPVCIPPARIRGILSEAGRSSPPSPFSTLVSLFHYQRLL